MHINKGKACGRQGKAPKRLSLLKPYYLRSVTTFFPNLKPTSLPHFCSSFFPLPFATFSLLTLGTLVRPSLSRNSVEFPYPLEPGIIAIYYFGHSNNGETRPRAVVFLFSEPRTKSDKVKLCR